MTAFASAVLARLTGWLVPTAALETDLRARFREYLHAQSMPVVRVIYLIGAVIPLVYLAGDFLVENLNSTHLAWPIRLAYLVFWAWLYTMTFRRERPLPLFASYTLYTLVGLIATCVIEGALLNRPDYIIATSLLYLIGLAVARVEPLLIATCGTITVLIPVLMLPALGVSQETVGRVTMFHAIWAVSATVAGIYSLRMNTRIFLAEHQLAFALEDARRLHAQEAALSRQMEHLAQTDSLTGLFNRRAFYQRVDPLLEQAMRYDRPLSVIVIDIDHFKRVNDTHGHAIGDAVIAHVALTCSAMVRDADVFARFGGEEFVLLLPETELPAAVGLGERLQEQVMQTTVNDVHVTISAGVSALEGPETIDALIARADQALYAAKSGGRNRVCAVRKQAGIATA